MSNFSSWHLAGRIGKAHGLKGQCFVHGTDRLVDEGAYKALVGDSEETRSPMTLYFNVSSRKRNILRIEGVRDRTGIEALYNKSIWLPPIGLDVWLGYAVVDDQQVSLGVISSWSDFGAAPFFSIHDATENQSLDIPITDAYFGLPLAAKSDGLLQLKVSKDHFAGLWSEL